jgi:uncharacterized membrane protein (DUF4010 family)
MTRLEREETYATLKFAVITVIVVPLLPDQVSGSPVLSGIVAALFRAG